MISFPAKNTGYPPSKPPRLSKPSLALTCTLPARAAACTAGLPRRSAACARTRRAPVTPRAAILYPDNDKREARAKDLAVQCAEFQVCGVRWGCTHMVRWG